MRHDFKISSRCLRALLALALIALLAGGGWFYVGQQKAMSRKVEENLGTIARLKTEQIAAWRRDQLGYAAALLQNQFLTGSVARFLAGPNAKNTRDLRARFRSLASKNNYADIQLVDMKGKALLGLVEPVIPLHKHVQALGEALRTGKPAFVDIHAGEKHIFPHIAVVVPCYSGAGETRKPMAALVLVSDASQFLYPLVESWPTPSKTGETLLVRPEGNEVLILNDLRHQPGTALKLRLPLNRTDAPAVMAALGKRGFVRGKDYRGIEVVAVIMPIPDSPWLMIAKIDAEESFADWHSLSAMMLAFILVFAACIAAVGLALWQRERKALYRDLYLAEAALRASVERHSVTLQAIGDAVIATDARGLVELVNPVAEELIGWNQEEAAGKPLEEVFQIVNEETRGKVADPFAKVLREGVVVGLANHTILIARDGTERPIADSGAPIRGEDGNITGVVLVFRDQTAERDTLRRLEENEERFRGTFEQAAVGVAHVAPNGRFLLINDRFCSIVGYTREEMLQKTFQDITHPEDLDVSLENVQQVLDGSIRNYSLEKRYICKDGSTVWIALTVSLVCDASDAPLYFISVVEDIARRKVAEERLRHLTLVLRALRDVNQLITREKDRQTLLRRACEILVETRGYHSAWIGLRESAGGMRVAAEAGIGAEFDAVRAALEAGGCPACCRQAQEGNGVALMHDTKVNCVACPLAPTYRDTAALAGVLRHAGSDYGTLVVALPVEMADDAEEQSLFRQLCEDIGFALRGIEVEAEQQKLQTQFVQFQKMESVGRLAGGVAHDFNNILGVIIGYAELALLEIGPGDPLHANLNEILKAAGRSRDITRQLLAFARKETIAPVALDLNASVEGMLKILRRLIGEDIDLAWHPGKALGQVLLDPSQLDQILANLCVNARDAIADVGKIDIETGTTTFDAAYCADHAGFVPGDYVLLSVSDDGSGMDRQTVEKIFEPFFTTKGVGKGTGLGLATVYGIVKQNNGFINVYSEPGEGAAFRIYLPRHAGDVAAEGRAVVEEVPKGRGETLLVVEDEEAILKLAEQILSSYDYKVLTAPTPLEALQAAETHSIDLLITDVVMPQMNGRELAEKLQSLYPRLKCLYMSGYTANAIAHRGVLEKGIQFIQKPFSPRELAAKVRTALDEKG